MATFKRKFRSKPRNFHVGSDWPTRTRRPPGSGQSNRKPPCVCCGSPQHGVWACTAFLQKSYEDRWQLAKDKLLCFRCLTGDHPGKNCMKSQDGETDCNSGVYEFSRVVFGKNSAPMQAQFVMQEHARRHRTDYPLGAETVLQSTYMDDSLDSVEEGKQGIELYHQLKSSWAKAGMHARKWVSNSAKVMAVIPEEDRATEVNIRDNKDAVTTTLGLQWNRTEDILAVPATPPSFDYPITKRNVLKKVATVCDPLGLVSPFIVQAKIMLQELWNRAMIGMKKSKMKWLIVFSYGSYI